LLPILLLTQSNAFGGNSGTANQDGAMGGLSPLIFAMAFLD
jgi:hypothetical protein